MIQSLNLFYWYEIILNLNCSKNTIYVFIWYSHKCIYLSLIDTRFCFPASLDFCSIFFTDYSPLFFSPWLSGTSHCSSTHWKHFEEINWPFLIKSQRIYIKNEYEILLFFTLKIMKMENILKTCVSEFKHHFCNKLIWNICQIQFSYNQNLHLQINAQKSFLTLNVETYL